MDCSADLAHYQGLVNRTAALVAIEVQLDADDIAQFLWIKVWRAVRDWNPTRARPGKGRDDYVFMCVQDQVKDLKKRPRRREQFLADLRLESEDSWDLEHGLAVDPDVAFAEAEDEPVQLPSSLTVEERGVIELLVSGYRQAEAARFLGWPPSLMERTMRSIRLKLADWRPVVMAPPTSIGARVVEMLDRELLAA